MKKIIIGLVMLSFKVGISQPISTYIKFIGDTTLIDWADGIIVYQDSFYILGTNFNKNQSFQHVSCFKTDNKANTILNKVYSTPSNYTSVGNPSSIRKTKDNYLIVAGADLDANIAKGVLFKFNLDFDTTFVKNYTLFDSLNNFFSVDELSNGNYLLCGTTNKTHFFVGWDAWYVVTDTLGNVIWQRTFGNSVDGDFASYPSIYPGGFLSTWYQWDTYDVNIINMSNDSTVKWIKKLGTPNGQDGGGDILATKDGGFIVSTQIDTGQTHDPYKRPDVIHKLDSNGNVVWKTYLPQSAQYKSMNKMLETSTGSIVLVGNIPVFQGTTNIPMLGWLVKLGSDGRIIWNQNYYTTLVNDQYLLDVKETPDGGYVACGTAINPATNNQDAWILKVDSNGCLDGFGCPKINYPTAIIPTEIEQSHFIIYPNPAISSFTIALTETPFIKEYKELQFTLFDITGRKVKETTLTEQTTTIQREDISAGVYLYQIKEGERSIKNGKLILK
jgi:hypothetical protein